MGQLRGNTMKMLGKKTDGRKSTYGAVTVFLTLILLPCMIFTCAFGDVSRVLLSESQAEAASDLALYSLLANYDEDLEEWYGLVASVQTIDQFYDVTESYFNGMMDANGIDGTASDLFTSYISSLKTGDSFADFLQVEITGETTVSAVSNAAMGSNAALIEDGIVEFMKYRGPVQIASNFIDRFTSLNVLKDLTDANENEPIVEAKQEYAQAEGDMLSDMLYTYIAIIQYIDYRNQNDVPNIDNYQTYAEHLSLIREDLQKVTELITEYYVFKDSIRDITQDVSFREFSLPYEYSDDRTKDPNTGYTYDFDDIGAEEQEDGTYSLSATEINKIINNANSYITAINNAQQSVVNACNGFAVPTNSNDVNPAVYCMKVQNAGITSYISTINTNGKKLMAQYAKILLALKCQLPENTVDTDWEATLENAKSSIESIRRNYLTYSNGTTTYEGILSNYYRVAVTNRTVKNVQDCTYEFTSAYCDGASKTIGQFFEAVRDEFTTISSKLERQIANIDTVLDGGEITYNGSKYTVVSLSSLEAAIQNYTDKREAWGSEAYSHGTKYAEKEQKEYSEAPSDSTSEFAAALGEDGVEAAEKLRTRLTNIRNNMQALKNAIESFTYGGESVYTLSRNKAIAAAQTVVPSNVSEVSEYISQNKTDAAGYYSQLVSPSTGSAIYTAPTRKSGETGNDPNLDIDPPQLYHYMSEAFPKSKLGDVVSEKDNQEAENKQNQAKAQEEADGSKKFDSSFLDDLGSDLPETTGGNKFSAGTVITGLVNVLQKVLNGNFDEFRDQVYVVEYAMDMFSYSSFNNEGKYNLAQDDGKTLTYKGDFKTNSFGDYNDAWKKEDATTLYDNQSLTNRPINSSNNYANLAEIEYILYGNSSNQKNLEAAYSSIFTIREVLNLVSGFQLYYSVGNTTANLIQGIAVSVQSATAGVIPIPLTKVILIGILATMETAYDMNRLKAGIPVNLYKSSDDDWYYALTGKDISSIFSKSYSHKEPDDTNGLFYSDYMYIFMLMAASNDSTYKSMLLRIGDLIEANVAKGKGESFDLESCQCYFQLTSTLRVKPLLLTLPIVNSLDGVDASSLLESSDWCTYKVSVIRGYS
jgi:hypothetical protein